MQTRSSHETQENFAIAYLRWRKVVVPDSLPCELEEEKRNVTNHSDRRPAVDNGEVLKRSHPFPARWLVGRNWRECRERLVSQHILVAVFVYHRLRIKGDLDRHTGTHGSIECSNIFGSYRLVES